MIMQGEYCPRCGCKVVLPIEHSVICDNETDGGVE